MKITKFGHACFLAEINGVSFLFDPGSFNKTPQVDALDAILITHEHGDHYEPAQVKELIAAHPKARVITHEAVGKKLTEEGIAFETIEPGQSIDVSGVAVESYGTEHAIIYGDTSPCRNTGFLINEELFVTGDAVHDVPPKHVRVLALPTGGPWMKISEAIDYAKEIKPEVAFSVHDGLYTEEVRKGFLSGMFGQYLQGMGIKFVNIENGTSQEL